MSEWCERDDNGDGWWMGELGVSRDGDAETYWCSEWTDPTLRELKRTYPLSCPAVSTETIQSISNRNLYSILYGKILKWRRSVKRDVLRAQMKVRIHTGECIISRKY